MKTFFAAVVVALVAGRAIAAAPDCRIAGMQAQNAWKTYSASLQMRGAELTSRSANRANARANTQWQTEQQNIRLRNRLANRAANNARFDRVAMLEDAYAVPTDGSDPLFAAARDATESAWAACHPGSATAKAPPAQHPLIAMSWRRLYAGLTPAERERLKTIDTSNTSNADWQRLVFAAADYAVHDIAPYDLETAGLAEWAGRFQTIPRVVDAASARGAVTVIEQTKRELYDHWGREHLLEYRSVEAALYDAIEAARGAPTMVNDGTLTVNYTMEGLAKASKRAVNGPRYPGIVNLGIGLIRSLNKAAH